MSLATTYRRLRDIAGRHFPMIDQVGLGIDPKIGARSERAFAYCVMDAPVTIYVADDLEGAPQDRIEGVLMHELGHAIDAKYGASTIRHRLGIELPTKPERRADVIASAVFGVVIRYDEDDVQSSAVGCTVRPSYLPR